MIDIEPLIRDATAADADALVGLLGQLGHPVAAGDVRATLTRMLAAPDVAVLVSELAGEIVGLATLHVFDLINRTRPHCRLTALVVDARHRRRGIGAALVKEVEGIARERDCFRLELTTRIGRPGALEFYTALGYAERPYRLMKELDPPPQA